METSNATILIIDDKQSNIHALENLLERPGRTFIHAMSGKDGLKLALNNNVDLIFLDVQMPEMDGFEVAQILKSNKRTKDIPIIFASAEVKDRHAIMKGFEEGAVDYLSKPLDPDLTKAKVSVLLQLQAQRRELMEKNLSLERAEARIRENMKALEAMNKELEAFSYSVSHDLRAPLRSIMGYAKVIEEDYHDRLEEDGKRALEIITQNADRMNKLIDDLLEFSRLGRKELVKADVDTGSLVNRLISEVNETMSHRAQIDVETLYPSHGDQSLLSQVWINLISNAIKYSSKKEKPVISITSEKSDNEVVYSVSDNGSGFDMAYADRLFNVFQRLHKQEEFEGTGVGLALVHKIITRHNGRIWAEAALNEGATFYFSLPLEQPEIALSPAETVKP